MAKLFKSLDSAANFVAREDLVEGSPRLFVHVALLGKVLRQLLPEEQREFEDWHRDIRSS